MFQRKHVTNSSNTSPNNPETPSNDLYGPSKDRKSCSPLWYSIASYLGKSFLIFSFLSLLGLLFYIIHQNQGTGGERFPDYSTTPLLAESDLQEMASLDLPPGNIAISGTGRIFFSFHPEYSPDIHLAEWHRGKKKYMSFPNDEFQETFTSPLAVRLDSRNQVLYCLDHGQYGLYTPTLYAFDISSRANLLKFKYEFPPSVAPLGSMLNDFQVSPEGMYIFIADSSVLRGTPALIVLDIPYRLSWRLLENHESVRAKYFTPHYHPVKKEDEVDSSAADNSLPISAYGLFPIRPHIDSIALDRKGKYLYYSAVNDPKLYRISTRYLHGIWLDDPAHQDAKSTFYKDITPYVEIYYDQKSMSDGIVIDKYDNIYITDFEHSSIHVIRPPLKANGLSAANEPLATGVSMETLIHSAALLRWPDGLSMHYARNGENFLYIACSALEILFTSGQGAVHSHAPFSIFRVKV